MASTIKIKRSNVAGKTPTISDIAQGELALNTKDQKLYSSNGTSIFEIGGTGAAPGLISVTKTTLSNATFGTVVVTDVSAVSANSYLEVANSQVILANTNAYIASVQSDVDTNEATELSHLANTNAYIASVQTDVDNNEATELSHLANTNAYIATKVNTTTFNSALANTNAYIASVQTDVDTNEATELSHLANTNAYIATKVNTTTFNSALANTNAYIAYVALNAGEVSNSYLTSTYVANTAFQAALANTNAYIASVAAGGGGGGGGANATVTYTALGDLNADDQVVTNVTGLLVGGGVSNSYLTSTYVSNTAFQSFVANTNAYIASSGGGGASQAAIVGFNLVFGG